MKGEGWAQYEVRSAYRSGNKVCFFHHATLVQLSAFYCMYSMSDRAVHLPVKQAHFMYTGLE